MILIMMVNSVTTSSAVKAFDVVSQAVLLEIAGLDCLCDYVYVAV